MKAIHVALSVFGSYNRHGQSLDAKNFVKLKRLQSEIRNVLYDILLLLFCLFLFLYITEI